MAEWPRSAARCTKSSGREAASRKLNAERVWKSTKSVINSFHEPVLRWPVQIQPVQRAVAERQVVFIPIPRIGSPPISARSPRPGDLQDLALKHPRPQALCSNPSFQRRPKITKSQVGSAFSRSRKTRPVRIEQLRISDVLLPHQSTNLAQRQLEFFGFRRGGSEQSVLDAARLGRDQLQTDPGDRRLGRLALQRMLHQLQQQLHVSRREREAMPPLAAVEGEM